MFLAKQGGRSTSEVEQEGRVMAEEEPGAAVMSDTEQGDGMTLGETMSCNGVLGMAEGNGVSSIEQ